MEISGKVVMINPKNQISEKFAKREIVVETQETYPQTILVEFHQDKCDLLDQFAEGDQVKIGINLRGRKWVNPSDGIARYFNTIVGWFIDLDKPMTAEEIGQKEADKMFKEGNKWKSGYD